MKAMKFVITQWIDEFDYDGMTCAFSILGEFQDLDRAKTLLIKSVKRLSEEQLRQRVAESGTAWHLMSIRGKTRPQYYRVNKNNKVVARGSFKLGDGSGFYSVYTYLELIKLPGDAIVDENLFDLKNCGFEVRAYLEEQRKAPIKPRKSGTTSLVKAASTQRTNTSATRRRSWRAGT